MKTKLLITGMMFLSGLGTLAQTKTFIGIQGGGNLSSINIGRTFERYPFNEEFLIGYHGGMIVKHFSSVKKRFLNAGLQSGLHVIQKGWGQSFAGLAPDYETRMNYLEFPFETVIYTGKGNLKYFFTMGGYLEFLLSVHQSEAPPQEITDNIEFDPYVVGRDKVFGYGARGSIGLQYSFPFGTIHLDGFISFSFSNVINYGTFDSGLPDLSNHYVFGASLAYLIPFGTLDF